MKDNKVRDIVLKVAYFTIPVVQSIAVSVGAYYVIRAIDSALRKQT